MKQVLQQSSTGVLGQAETEIREILARMPPDVHDYNEENGQGIEDINAPLMGFGVACPPKREIDHAVDGTNLGARCQKLSIWSTCSAAYKDASAGNVCDAKQSRPVLPQFALSPINCDVFFVGVTDSRIEFGVKASCDEVEAYCNYCEEPKAYKLHGDTGSERI